MKYSGIIKNDVANGPGIRTSLFVSGCRNKCPGCFNVDQQDFNYGQEFTIEVEDSIIESVSDIYHNGITILGGDPLEPENASVVLDFVYRFREVYEDRKTIWLYTGYIFEDIIKNNDARSELLNQVDVIVDGPFILDKKDITLRFKGSSNQRIIDMKSSIRNSYTPVVIG